MNKEKARFNMIEQQIRPWDVSDPAVLNLMASIPRELFVPDAYKEFAFADFSIPLDFDQFMFTPREEARMIQALEIKPTDKILEIGTGTGFTTCLMASLGKKVTTVDIHPELVTSAEKRFQQMNLRNINTEIADIATGWKPAERFDVIAITVALPKSPQDFFNLLREEGRLFCIEGETEHQYANIYRKLRDGTIQLKRLFSIQTPQIEHAKSEHAFVF